MIIFNSHCLFWAITINKAPAPVSQSQKGLPQYTAQENLKSRVVKWSVLVPGCEETKINVLVCRESLHCAIFCASEAGHRAGRWRRILGAHQWAVHLVGGWVTSLELTTAK